MAPSTDPQAPTPIMRQYQAAKRQFPEALLLFRLGDFYELFYDDAVTAAGVLQITLTARNKEKGQQIPMCGVPYHAAEHYVAKLIAAGHKVAICDQMEDPRQAKGLVRREVTRILTPGTAAFQLGEGDNRFLAAVARAGKEPGGAIGLALLDVSTGEFHATEFTGSDADARLADELARWRPRELLHAAPADGDAPLWRGPRPEELSQLTLTKLEPWMFEPDFAQAELHSHFGVLSLEGFGLAGRRWAQAAAGAIVHYVKETQRSQLLHVDRLGYYERQHGLVLDAVTARNLELTEPLAPGQTQATLRAALDQAVTAMGKRLLRQWLLRPSGDLAEIRARHQAVAALLADRQRRAALRTAAGGVQDLERLLARVSLETALPRDLLALAQSLDRVPDIRAALATAPRLEELAARLDDCAGLRAAITSHLVETPPATLADGGFIRPGVSAELDRLRALSHGAKSALAEIETRERARTTIGSLKVRFNSIFGYYIEVSKPNLRLVPTDYERKQTLVNAERFTTPELKELETTILGAEDKARTLELELFTALRARASADAARIRQNAQAIAEADLLASFAQLAAERDYCCPDMGADAIEIQAGRHPVVELLGWQGLADRFVPNDLYLGRERQRLLLLTGPNMGGKSTYLRQAALIAIMAQMGSFVPARAARLPLLDRIFTRIGASDNLVRGRSTFMVEMTESAVILNQATASSLVILDEVGRGTATYDGLSLAWAMVEYLHDHNHSFTLFATHYHELTELAAHLDAVENAQVAVREPTADGSQEIAFLRRVVPGAASRSYGIEVARLAGLPRGVLDRARQVLTQHQRANDRATDKLEPPADSHLQLTLFTPLSQQIVDRLASADLNHLSPLEALNLLAELKERLGN